MTRSVLQREGTARKRNQSVLMGNHRFARIHRVPSAKKHSPVFRAIWLDCSTRFRVCSADPRSDKCRRHQPAHTGADDLRADAIADVIADVSGRCEPRAFDAPPPNLRHADMLGAVVLLLCASLPQHVVAISGAACTARVLSVPVVVRYRLACRGIERFRATPPGAAAGANSGRCLTVVLYGNPTALAGGSRRRSTG
jgi:hypothetical protein